MNTHHLAFSKTRLAPTPSGYLHAGNAFNFLLTAALAQKANAAVLLRIDDLDRERYRTAYAQDVFDTLNFLHIEWQQGPKNVDDFEAAWSQRWRMKWYEEVLQKLREKNLIFACTCTRTQTAACNCYGKHLSLDTTNASWRMITNDDPIAVQMLEGNMAEASLPAAMKNYVVRKKDGLPAYQLTSVVDDLHFGVDFIVRGQDLWPSTLAQQFLAKQLGEERFASIAFYHHPLLTNSLGEKLAKSAGDASINHWRESKRSLREWLVHLAQALNASDGNTSDDWRIISAFLNTKL